MLYNNYLELIGNTPVVKLNTFRNIPSELFIKLEGNNPVGSMKDRVAKHIVESAERNYLLKKGGTIIESSSGNLAIGLAMVSRVKGYNMICVVDPKISPINLSILRAYNAQIIMVTDCDESGNYLETRINTVKKVLKDNPEYYWPNQYNNPWNPETHKKTAREIYNDFNGELEWLVLPIGTAGLATGCAEEIKKLIPSIKIMVVDAIGSVIFDRPPGKRHLTGIGASIVPPNVRRELYDEIMHVSDKDAFYMNRFLASKEGILVGGSSGAAIYAALKLAIEMNVKGRILSVLPDRGDRYVDTIYSDSWLLERGIDMKKIASNFDLVFS